MRTSEQVYHQIRWDPRLDPARFVLGVQQRDAPAKRVALPAFAPGGEVPWHRVLFVEADGEVVWDRASGVDLVGETGAGRVRAPRRLRAPAFAAATPHVWDPLSGWTPGTRGVPTVAPRVVTWNVLWDRYDGDLIDTERRTPLLLAALRAADADVIALQEVRRDLLAVLLAQPWVRADYTADVDPTGPDVEATGVVLLSRLPVLESGRLALSAHKAVAAAVVDTGAEPLVVAATHLTSDHTADGAAKRKRQLAVVAEAFAGFGEVVLAGDFNDGSARPGKALDLRDAWTQARDDDAPTFDPGANPLAAISSLSGRAARLDRVFLRGGLRAVGAELLGTRPVDGVFVSDHYGVLVDLEPRAVAADVLDVAPSARTAVVWLPGPWPEVDRVRAEHDRRARRWPAHVTLLFGFAPESEFARAVPLLADAVAAIEPFPVSVDGVGVFGEDVVWLDPAAAGARPWEDLHAAARRRFPRCAARFTPHLTVGGSRRAAEGIAPRVDRVGELVVLSRRGAEPMRPRAVVSLGTGEVRWCAEEPTAPVSLDAVAERVTAVLSGVLELHVVGSRRMGCAVPDADLDLITVSADPAAVEAAVRAVLPEAVEVRAVVGTRTPGLRFAVDGLGVDLTVADPADPAVALSAVTDAEALRAGAGLARRVRAWARARGLDSAPFGGVPGVGWSVLAAIAARTSDDPAEFFARWAAWDWRDPIALTDPPARTGAPVTILTPTDPVRSCTDQVGPGFRDLLTEELYRAWELTSAGAAATLTAPPDLHRAHAAWAVLTAPNALVGQVRGRLRALLTAIEATGARDVHAWPRPFEHTATVTRYAIGLGRTPPPPSTLADVTSAWTRGVRGVEVAWTGNGEVPTLR
ncbi:RNA repair domain-containing protein [Actinosynnema sp. NPDC020468]|uniref:RNA repair domain-containing protein n=1 Tax=Actinosynnema sp. NPDC020468 TaxID=3154488 RepID=UPI0033E88B75